MKFVITVTVKSPSSKPVDITWYRGDNHAEALAALVQAGAKDIADESMPESIRTKVTAVRMDIFHDAEEVLCDRHGGLWGSDKTCRRCTDSEGVTRPLPEQEANDVEGCSCGMADKGAPGHDHDEDDVDEEEEGPWFTHDCSGCAFLGVYKDSRGLTHDLYYCASDHGKGGSVITRYSNDGPDYLSTSPYALIRDPRSPLAEARRRAVEAGLIEGKI